MRLRARPAKESDCMLIFSWITDHRVRTMSLNQDQSTLEAYTEEFERIVRQQKTHVLIIEQYEDSGNWIPIAHVQVDEDGEITMSLACEDCAQHLGAAVIKTGIAYIRRYPSIEKLVAHMKCDNVACVKAFEGAGFRLASEPTPSGHQYLEYTFTIPHRTFGLFY